MDSGELEVFSSLLKQSDGTETSNGERASHFIELATQKEQSLTFLLRGCH